MVFKFTLLVLPALTLAEIDIYVTGTYKDLDAVHMNLYFRGKDEGIITNTEKNTFKLTDYNLKNIIRSTHGKSPDNAFLRSPTPWGDIYKTYKWPQVTRTLAPRHGRISSIIASESVMLRQLVLANNGDKQATFSVGVSKEVDNIVKTTWNNGGELSVTERIHYDIGLDILRPGRNVSFVYNSTWGKSNEQLQTVKIGSTSPLEIVLETDQYVSTQLNATKVSLQFEMEYEATLSGVIATNYAQTYKGHHFKGYLVEECMSNGNLSNLVVTSEVKNIDFYLESRLIVQDYLDNILVYLRL